MKKVLTIALLVISFLGFITACETISHDPLVESPQANVSHQNADLSSVVAKTNPNERAAASPSVTIPFNGNYTSSSDAVKWYNKTGSTAHKAYATFDDSNAYDINLAGDRDQALPVLSPFAGTVTKLGTTFPGTTDGGSLGAVLINIGNGNYVGYMHLKSITVKNGDAVTAGQQIGKIGNVGADNNHLHFAYYTKEGTVLKSKTVSFTDRAFTMPLSWKDTKIVMKVNVSNQITGTVPFGDKGSIEAKTYVNNTWWSSDDSKTAKVDGNGKVTGVKVGSTTIRVKFSGQEFTFPVTVK
jgi:biotin carboxyl carrier protein